MTNDSFQPKTQEILLKGKSPKENGVFCETFVYQPRNIEEMKLGSLFILGRLEKAPQASHIINLLTSIIKREYYFNTKNKPLKSLEAAFKKANSALADLAKNGDFSWLAKMDFVCAILAKNVLHLTKIGRAKILLVREGTLTDIGKKLVPSQEKVHPQKIFQSIASGKIFLHDKIIMATGDVFKHIPQKGLKQIVESGEIKQLENIMRESENFSTQGIILVETIREKEIPIKGFEPMALKIEPEETIAPGRTLASESRLSAFKSEFLLFFRDFLFKTRDRWQRMKQAAKERMPAKETKTAPEIPALEKPAVEKTDTDNFNAALFSRNVQPIKNNKRWQRKARKTKLILRNLPYLTVAAMQSSYREFLKGTSRRAKKILLFAVLIAIVSAVGARYYLNQKYLARTTADEQLAKQAREKLEQIEKIYSIKNPVEIPTLPEKTQFSRVDTRDGAASMEGKLPFSEAETTDWAVFNNNLYVLSSVNNQIAKCPDFSSCQSWTKGSINLSSAVSLAVDGSVYVLEKNGTIAQFFNGALKNSVKTKIRPALSENAKILAAPELNNLYILDGPNKRIAALAKNGDLIKQYYFPSLSDISDFQVSPDEKSIFVLAGEKIYQIAN